MTSRLDAAIANVRAALAESLHVGWPDLSVGDCVRIADSVIADLVDGNPELIGIVKAFLCERRTRSRRKGTP